MFLYFFLISIYIRAEKRKASKAKLAAASALLELNATTISDIELEAGFSGCQL